MSETTYIDTIWSGPRALMETLVTTLAKDARVAAVAPLVDVTFGDTTRTVARIRSTEPLGAPPAGVSTETETVGAIAVGVFMAGPPKAPNVSLRALLRALYGAGFISRAEALAAAKTGDIPASLRAPLFAAVDADTAFEIELAWAAMYEAERSSPFWGFVVAAGIATDEQIDAVFAAAAQA